MWEVEMTTILRHLIDDTVCPYTYDDDRLQQLMLVAAQLVQVENDFTTYYDINIENYTLKPDPTNIAYRDDPFVNLVVLKAACLLASSGLPKTTKGSMLVVEGPTRYDGRSKNAAKKLEVETWCGAYADAKRQFSYSGGSCPGEAIIGPYRSLTRSGPAYFFGSDYPINDRENRI